MLTATLPNFQMLKKKSKSSLTLARAEKVISQHLLSGNQAHSRSDRELHGSRLISEQAQAEIHALKLQHPDKRIMLIAEKGTMGVGSSRMFLAMSWRFGQANKQAHMFLLLILCQWLQDNGISPIF